jgi:hypothetical protein
MRITLRKVALIAALLFVTVQVGTVAQEPRSQAAAPAAADWHELVDHLADTWTLTGDVMGHAAHHTVRAEWVLSRQFLRIEERTSADAPADERRYDSIWFLGYDDVSDRYDASHGYVRRSLLRDSRLRHARRQHFALSLRISRRPLSHRLRLGSHEANVDMAHAAEK